MANRVFPPREGLPTLRLQSELGDDDMWMTTYNLPVQVILKVDDSSSPTEPILLRPQVFLYAQGKGGGL